MDNLKEAKRLYRNYRAKFNRIKQKIRKGCPKASLRFIELLTEEDQTLRNLGYSVKDGGGLEPYNQVDIDKDMKVFLNRIMSKQ